jgi:hypothetical protein
MVRKRKPPAGKSREPPLIDILPGMLVSALAENHDFILCFENGDEGRRPRVHVMTGAFVSPCMLRKLIGQAASQKDEGSTWITREWDPSPRP